jgi:hypothetical protein
LEFIVGNNECKIFTNTGTSSADAAAGFKCLAKDKVETATYITQ